MRIEANNITDAGSKQSNAIKQKCFQKSAFEVASGYMEFFI